MASIIDGYDYDSFRKRFNQVTGNEKHSKVAERLDISESKLCNMLSGNGKANITMKDLYNIAKEYGCSIDYLMGTDNIQPSPQKSSGNFSDFVQRFLYLFETEDAWITFAQGIDDVKLVVMFNNPVIQRFLADLRKHFNDHDDLDNDVVYDAWKKQTLIKGKMQEKTYDYKTKEQAYHDVERKFDDINEIYMLKGGNSNAVPRLTEDECDILCHIDKNLLLRYRRIIGDIE